MDARELGTKMRKSLGDKRKELTPDAIDEVTRLYTDALDLVDSEQPDPRVKVMANQDFGFARITVERPLRRVWTINDDTLAAAPDSAREEAATFTGQTWTSETTAKKAIAALGLDTKTVNAVLKAIAVSDPNASPIAAKKGAGFEPDPDLRDAENIPVPDGYLDMSPTEQVTAVMLAAESHLKAGIHPYVPDAWIDHSKTKIGYEIPFTRQFYVYTAPRPVSAIRADIDTLESQIQGWMQGLAR